MLFKCCLALISVPHTWFHGDWFLGDDTIQVGGSGAFAQIDHRHVLLKFKREKLPWYWQGQFATLQTQNFFSLITVVFIVVRLC